MNDTISDDMATGVTRTANMEQRLGKLLLDAGKLGAQDAEKILRLQKNEGMRFGDAAIKLGLVTEADIQQALAQQFDYPYLEAGAGGFSKELVAAYQPFSTQVEQIRALRSQLILRWFALGHKTLAAIATEAESGVSNLVANLAVVFSQLGERTLVIDADLRKPRQHLLFNLGNRKGLSDILIGRADQSAIVKIPAFIGLSVLTAGTVPPNPTELLARPGFKALLDACSENYDVILIDSAPANHAEAIGTCVRSDGILVVARQNLTRSVELGDVVARLTALGSAVVGTALVQF